MSPRWWVVTGAPWSGKSTLLAGLASHGLHTEPEIARLLIDRDLAAGLTLDAIRGDEHVFHLRVAEGKVRRDLALDLGETIVFDRGLPDTLAFGRYFGWPVPPVIEGVNYRSLYAGVIVLDRLPHGEDYAHPEWEDDAFLGTLDALIEAAYADCGVPVHRLPVSSREQRVERAFELISAVRPALDD